MSTELFSQAVSLHRQGRLEDAGRLYLRMLEHSSPADSEVRYLLAFLRYQQGRIGEALQAVEAALSRDPTVAKALLLHGILLHATGKPVEALAQLTAAAARDPGNVEIWYSRGVLLGEVARHEEALLSFDKALSIRPTAECWNNRGATLQSLKRWPEALQSFDAALALKPDYAQVWTNRARVLQDLGRFEEAVAACGRALSLAPDFVVAWNERGNALLRSKRFEEALASYDRALAIQPDHVPAIVQRAVALQNLYHLDEAIGDTEAALKIQPGNRDAQFVRAGTLGRLNEAEAGFRHAIKLNPNLVEAHANLGNVLREQGKLDAAEVSYRHAIALQPDEAGAHIGLGNVLTDRGDLEGAIDCYRRALALNPNIAETHNNCGNALNDLGRLEEAIACYQQALVLVPDLVQAHNNIAVVAWNQGKLEEAKVIFRQIIQSHPTYVTALDNLASLLSVQGDVVAATNVICQSLKLQQTKKAQRTFVEVIRNGRWIEDNDTIRSLMVRALTEPWGRPSDLAQVGAELLKLDAHIGPCIAKAVTAWPNFPSAQELYEADGPAALLDNPVLCAFLNSAQNPDVEMERFLTAARHLLLEAAVGAVASDEEDEALSFYSALAHQCFINEYVFSQSEEDGRQVDALCARLTAALEAGKPVSALWVTAIAAYRSLGSVPLAARLLDRQLPEPLAALLAQQIIGPQAEALLRAKIPRLTVIADGISRDVQQLYEENPYPRWVRTARGEALNGIAAYLNRKFPLARFQRRTVTSADILIAGCGTGQHSIEVARRFRDAQVLAIDLSLSSLAYARRKSQELELTNIEYGQADILELGALGRNFDLVESAGVLHHMANPYAAWGTLLSLLRPGGFMLVGLYSEVARRDILRARRFIAARQFEPVPEQIRQCRQEIMASSEAENFTSLLKMSDFFSISTCRDLLFHVQEFYVTLAGIDDYLRANELKLLGFEINPNTLHAYRQRFPNDPAATDLGQWQIFEKENPDTFSSMYQFWIQKPA
jgi:tetratricopeptide (TPR) repeat protein/2-polyprenyl-3-methyl-5-hydroxy-6-metoxy-1,4-benzoquinol methylase